MKEGTLKELLPTSLKPGLTKAEKGLLNQAPAGKPLDLRSGNPETDKPENASKWGRERTLRAEFLRWLCTDEAASKLVHDKGIAVAGVRIEGELDFEAVTLTCRLSIIFSALPAGIVFQDASTRALNFSDCHCGSIRAGRLKTRGSVFFQNVVINGEVRLLGAEIGGQLSCTGAKLSNPEGIALDAEGMQVEGAMFWRNISLSGALNLIHARVGQLVDDEQSWPEKNKLMLDGFEYGALAGDAPRTAEERLAWLRLQPQNKNTFWPQPYEQLAKVFRSMGHESDAVKILIAKQEDLRKFGKLSRKAKAWNWFLGKTIAHGYKPWKAFWPIILFVIAGTAVFAWANNEGVMQPSKERVYLDSKFIETQQLPDRYPRFQSFTYSVDTFFPFVDLHQEDYWLPGTSFPATKYLLGEPWGVYFRIYLWVHIILGWVLSAFAVAALTRLTRKD